MPEPRDELLADRYRRVATLGAGAMGEVWLADDLVLGRRVAVKQVRTAPGAAMDTVAVDRMAREARTAARLHHPNVVAVHDLVTVDGQPYVIMEYVEGESLGERLRRSGTLPMADAAAIVRQIATGLEAAHRLGIVHRDIKPANIMITDEGQAKLADFGIARAHDEVSLTDSGMMVGTLAFMAPELVNSGVASAASDVWSLGATLFATVEGHAPFVDSDQDETSGRLVYRLMSEDAPGAERAGVAAPLIARMLAREPGQRPTAAEVARRLANLDASPVPAAAPAAVVSDSTTHDDRLTTVRPAATQSSRPRWRVPAIAFGFVVVLAIAALAAYLVNSGGSPVTTGHPTGSVGSGPSTASSSPGSSTTPTGAPVDQASAAFDDPSEVGRILRGAANDITALYTYDYRHLPQHDQQVKDLTTGSFGASYVQLFTKTIDPAVRHDKLSLTSTPVAIGMGPLTGGQATVFVVVDSTRTTGQDLTPQTVQRRNVLLLLEVGGSWLVSGIHPEGIIKHDPPGTTGLSAALAAARSAVGLLVGLTDANEAAHLPQLRALTTGTLATKLAGTVATLSFAGSKRGFGRINASTVASASGDKAVVLLSTYKFVSTTGTTRPTRRLLQLQATMQRVRGTWLMSAVREIK